MKWRKLLPWCCPDESDEFAAVQAASESKIQEMEETIKRVKESRNGHGQLTRS